MSAYSNVLATSLKNAANTAINELSSHNLATISDSLTTNIMSPKSCSLVKGKLNNINSSTSINGSVALLKKKLTNLKSAAEHMEKIQKYESSISYYRRDKDDDGKIKTSAQNNIYYYQRLISGEEATIRNLLS